MDIAFSVRSQKEFFREAKKRDLLSLGIKSSKSHTDKFLRESIVVSAHTRNMGLQWLTIQKKVLQWFYL